MFPLFSAFFSAGDGAQGFSCAVLYCTVLCCAVRGRQLAPAYMHIHTRTYTRVHTRIHTYTRVHAHVIHAHTRALTHERTHTCTHTWVYTHTHIRARPTRHRVLFIGSFLLLLLFLVSWDCFACFLPVWTLLKTLPKLSLYISSKLKLGNKKLSSFSASCFPLFPPF